MRRECSQREDTGRHWLVTYDVFRSVLETKHLAIRADLRLTMPQAIEQWAVDGWVDCDRWRFSAIGIASVAKFTFS
jgi:hypothetical protein